MAVRHAGRRAFTTVELLTVIAIIAILMALLLPAVGMIREMARQTQCLNNLSNIGKAFQMHASSNKIFPNAGGYDKHPGEWNLMRCDTHNGGFDVTAEPLRVKSSKRQDWGWAYQILPYIEKETTYNSPARNFGNPDGQPIAHYREWMVNLYFCPSRRKPEAPIGVGSGQSDNENDRGPRPGIDYAGNGGYRNKESRGGKWPDPTGTVQIFPFPNPISRQHADGMVIPGKRPLPSDRPGDPIKFYKSDNKLNVERDHVEDEVLSEYLEIGGIPDGASTTILVGERRAIPARQLPHHDNLAEDNGYVAGYTWDTIRWGYMAPQGDHLSRDPILPDDHTLFGSSHGQICHFVMADGSTRKINYLIDLPTFRAMCSRNDGNIGYKEPD